MSRNLAFIKFPKRRNLSIDIFAVVFMATIICPINCFSRQITKRLVKKESPVYLANLNNCKLLTQIDSIIEFAKDSLPNCNFENLKWISIVRIEEPRDTTYYTYKGRQYFNTKDFDAKDQDIINIFEGKRPSHDLRIVFGGIPFLVKNEKILQFAGRLYEIEDYVYNILKTKYKFSKVSIKEKYWDNIPLYEVPAFSFVITKEGILKEFQYGSTHTWVKHIFD